MWCCTSDSHRNNRHSSTDKHMIEVMLTICSSKNNSHICSTIEADNTVLAAPLHNELLMIHEQMNNNAHSAASGYTTVPVCSIWVPIRKFTFRNCFATAITLESQNSHQHLSAYILFVFRWDKGEGERYPHHTDTLERFLLKNIGSIAGW